MTALRFSEPEMRQALESLEKGARATFAAACAQRLLSSYARYGTKKRTYYLGSLSPILDRLWGEIEENTESAQLWKDADLCLSLMPIDQADSDDLDRCVEDAIASVVYAIRTQLKGDSQDAVWAAARAYETVDAHVISRLNRGRVERDIEPKILAHPLIQSELRRQQRDLQELRDLAKTDRQHRIVVAEFRQRAQSELMDLS